MGMPVPSPSEKLRSPRRTPANPRRLFAAARQTLEARERSRSPRALQASRPETSGAGKSWGNTFDTPPCPRRNPPAIPEPAVLLRRSEPPWSQQTRPGDAIVHATPPPPTEGTRLEEEAPSEA